MSERLEFYALNQPRMSPPVHQAKTKNLLVDTETSARPHAKVASAWLAGLVAGTVSFGPNPENLDPNQIVALGPPVLATRPVECSFGFHVEGLVTGARVTVVHRRATTLLETHSFDAGGSRATIFLMNELEEGDEVTVSQRAPHPSGGLGPPGVSRSFEVEGLDGDARKLALSIHAPALCSDVWVISSHAVPVDITFSNAQNVEVYQKTLRPFPYRGGPPGGGYRYLEYASQSFGDEFTVRVEAELCGEVFSESTFPSVKEKKQRPPPTIQSVSFFDTGRILVTYDGKEAGARVDLLKNGSEIAWTRLPFQLDSPQTASISATDPTAAPGDSIQLTRRSWAERSGRSTVTARFPPPCP